MSKFTPQQWREAFGLLDTVLDLPEVEREGWLVELARTQPHLQPALRELLARHATGETGDFLKGLPQFTHVANVHATTATLQVGEQVGPYRLLRELGQGGMGSVWLAERDDVRRFVALKLPHVSWTGQLAEQMARERDILAALEHPNIARLYDAGIDEAGRPFMAMEYVEGQPIDQYCRERHLPVEACLRLVLEVAKAVAHAHSKLVVHRDLKPSNMLVAADGSPRLLDFGIARLLAAEPGAQTRMTRFGARALTPDYASPEQIKGEAIGTATDVYSLGVVCYELLTGSRPYRLRRASAAELEQAIAETDPLPASAAATERTRRRRLRGDLDAILNKALKKEPAERYATIDAFAQDIERHLRGLPVQARPDGGLYRFGRLVARHKVGTAATFAVVIAILAGAAIAIWQAGVARDQARRAENINAFILSLFNAAGPGGGGGADLRVTELLTQSLSRVEQELPQEPRRQVELYTTVGDALRELNAYPQSVVAYDKALDLATRQGWLASDEASMARIGKADALVSIDNLDGAQKLLDDTERTLRGRPPSLPLARAWLVRSSLQVNRREPADAVKSAQAGADLIGKLQGRTDLQYLRALRALSLAQFHANQCAQAIPNLDFALNQLPKTIGGDKHPEITTVRGVRARCLRDLKRYDESLADFERNDAEMRAIYGERSMDYATELVEHGAVERFRGNPEAAVELTARGAAIMEANGVQGYSMMGTYSSLTRSLVQGRYVDRAVQAARKYQRVALETYGTDDNETRTADMYLTLLRGLKGDLAYAVPRFEEAIRSLPATGAPASARSQSFLGWLLLLNGNPRRAAVQLEASMPALAARGEVDAAHLAMARARYGLARLESGDLTGAREAMERGLQEHSAIYALPTADRADIWIALTRLHLQLGDAQAALGFARQADEFWTRHDPASRWAGEAAYWNGKALLANGQPAAANDAFARAARILKASPFPIDAPLTADARARS
jgi:eukaryotic-like serine/threonine-protein kinase